MCLGSTRARDGAGAARNTAQACVFGGGGSAWWGAWWDDVGRHGGGKVRGVVVEARCRGEGSMYLHQATVLPGTGDCAQDTAGSRWCRTVDMSASSAAFLAPSRLCCSWSITTAMSATAPP